MSRFADRLREYSPSAARAPRWRVTVEAIGVFLVLWVLHLPYFSQPTFLDEFDNMVGGNVVAQGGAIYADYISQHTPIAYWISAVGHSLGAEYFNGQRLFGFGVFALLLALLYLRNARTFGRVPMLVVVILVPMMHFYNPDLSYTVLSDNYQAIMCLYLLFEVAAIGIFRDTSLNRWVVIGIASTFAFGVAFISIYYVAAATLTAAILSIIGAKERVVGARKWVRFVALRAGVYLAPFAILVLVVASTGALADAYRQAYVLNRTYYSRYVAEGLGSDALRPLYAGLENIVTHIVSLPNTFQVSAITGVRELVGIALLLAVSAVLMRVQIVLGIGILWMGSLTATRGWNGFHAQPLWMFVIGCLGILVFCLFATWRSANAGKIGLAFTAAALSAVTILGAIPYAFNVYLNRDTLWTPVSFPQPGRSQVIETLVPEGGKYAELGINNVYDFVVTRRTPAGGFAGVVPWFSDMLDDEMADRLVQDDPVVIFSNDTNEVWGFNILDNAPALAEVINGEYTRIDLSPIGINEGVYIRNDVLDDSLDKISREFSQEFTTYNLSVPTV